MNENELEGEDCEEGSLTLWLEVGGEESGESGLVCGCHKGSRKHSKDKTFKKISCRLVQWLEHRSSD